MLWQPIRPFEFTSPVIDIIKYPFLAIKPISSFIFANPYLRSMLTTRQVNERILEIPFVLLKIKKYKLKILDIGANESPISLMLASSGYKVTALDLRQAAFKHPNLTNVCADVTQWKKENYFDTVICLSTLEHIGLEVYGGKKISNGDQLAIDNIYASLKTGGKLLLTVPTSSLPNVTDFWRSYDKKNLTKLLSKFKKISFQFGIRDGLQHWMLVENIPANHRFDPRQPSGVALVEAIK